MYLTHGTKPSYLQLQIDISCYTVRQLSPRFGQIFYKDITPSIAFTIKIAKGYFLTNYTFDIQGVR